MPAPYSGTWSPAASTWMLGLALACASVMLSAGEAWADGAPSWEEVPPMITPRGDHTATVLQDGRVLVAGGYATSASGGSLLRDVEIYDPASKSWAPAASLGAPLPRVGATVLLPSGEVLATDGIAAQRYSPALDEWTSLPPLPTSLSQGSQLSSPSAVLLPSGNALVVGLGGSSAAGFHLAGSVYDPTSSSWTAIPTRADLAVGLDARATLLDDGRVLVVTGKSGAIYDPGSNAWAASPELGHRQYLYRAVRLASGDVLVVGTGNDEPGSPYVVTASEVYLRESNLWMTTESTSIDWQSGDGQSEPACWGWGTMGIGVSLLPSGRVLRTGGMRNYSCDMRPTPWNPDLPLVVNYAWMLFDLPTSVYDPASFSWAPLAATPPVTMARAHHTATLLDDGSVLIAGGYVDDPAFDGDPETAIVPATASAVLFHELPPRGAPCATGSDCASGFCADSVCCDAACADPDHACAVAAGASQDGICTPLSGAGGDGGSGGDAGQGGSGGDAGQGGSGGDAGQGGSSGDGGSGGDAGQGGSATGDGGGDAATSGTTGSSGSAVDGSGGTDATSASSGSGSGGSGAQSGAGGGSSGGEGESFRCHMTPDARSAPSWLLLLGGLATLRLRRRIQVPPARRPQRTIP
ncbi:kelch repeat-containing protein [Sorangium sp. So ce1036]|uniref:Kelch repeat-containing protein n=1 Tax=Sorangium sp. So ce1036 TaxID=3133328 RepID=UPI003F0DD182